MQQIYKAESDSWKIVTNLPIGNVFTPQEVSNAARMILGTYAVSNKEGAAPIRKDVWAIIQRKKPDGTISKELRIGARNATAASGLAQEMTHNHISESAARSMGIASKQTYKITKAARAEALKRVCEECIITPENLENATVGMRWLILRSDAMSNPKFLEKVTARFANFAHGAELAMYITADDPTLGTNLYGDETSAGKPCIVHIAGQRLPKFSSKAVYVYDDKSPEDEAWVSEIDQ